MDENPYSAPSGQSGNFDPHPRKKVPKIFSILSVIIALVFLLPVLAALLLPGVSRGREAARRVQCGHNLRQIGRALHNYLGDYGTFPPAYTVDANGKPMHSWRTLLLPYLDQHELYRKIDLSKAWDDPINIEASKSALVVYRCPSSPMEMKHSSYVAIVNDESCFPQGEAIAVGDIKDGPSNTLMVVEVPADKTVPWMSPRDIDQQAFLNLKMTKSSHPSGGFHGLLADGAVRFISASTSPAILSALISRSLGDALGDF